MLFTKMSGRSMQHSVLVGLVCLAIASAISCSSVGSSDNSTMCSESERHALLRFKQALVDESNSLASWKTEKDCCKWRGIACNNHTGHVITLDLSSTFLGGEISPSLLELKYLNYLDFSNNDFGGVMIPKFVGSLSQLKELGLRDCNFSGHVPPELGNLSILRTLDLSWNDFGGMRIPEFIGSLSQLKELKLIQANFSGRVPPQLGNLSNMHTLDLSRNAGISSENLEWLAHLSFLRYLDMSELDFSKVVNWPQSLSKLTSLRELHLSQCNLPHINLRSLSYINSSTSLQILDLSSNKLEDLIPNVFTSMLSLVILDLSENNLEGGIPKGFQNLCRLKWLLLWENKLSGNIEDSIQALTCANNTLETLDLRDNQFWGSIPELTGFSKLSFVCLSNNTLNGSLPESVGQLSSLEVLYLEENSMSGVITESHFRNLSRLQSLDLSGNIGFSINLSSDWNPPFQLTVLLEMSSCKVGPAFPKWILKQTNLTVLSLSNTGISGSLPDNFGDLFPRLNQLDLSMNKIHGILPNLSTMSLAYVNLSSNLFSGVVPSFPLTLDNLDLSHNKFSEPLSSFCATSSLDLYYLDISDNLLSGELPNCWMQFQNLGSLDLGRNKLSGKLPNSFGTLKHIGFLRLHENNFSGELPSLENCTNLYMVDLGNNNLSGKIPYWVGQSVQSLLILRLRSNQFDGIIPLSLCNLAIIHVLDLSHNNISGALPHCFNNISAWADDSDLEFFSVEMELVWKGIEIEFGKNLAGMRSIDMSSNYLVGELPPSIARMTELISLNLSRNYLTGKLPEDFGNMKMLESLDLSRNNLSGNIPTSFSRLNYLGVLDVSHNHLSGRIPLGTQLQSFNSSSYAGNLGLCGQPLTPNCSGDGTTEDDGIMKGNATDNEEHGNDGLLNLGFLISTVLGFISGFWIICGSLLLKSSWRYAYFKFLDDSRDWIHVKMTVYKAKMQRRLQR